MSMTGNIQRPTSTERLARAALELHRLAMTAAEVQHLPSPLAHREQTSKRGAQDPTATTALDEHRVTVADAVTELDGVVRLLTEDVRAASARITAALNQWDGR